MNKSESKYFNTAAKMDLALIELLKKKPFDYITVSDICAKAQVNRSTFYLHYENIGDLLDETTQYMLRNFLSYFSDGTESAFPNLTECDLDELVFICDKYLRPYLSYIKDNKDVFSTILLHFKTFKFEEVYKQLFENIFNPILDRFDYPVEKRKYVMMYYLNGVNAIIAEWIKDGCEKSISEISEIITICIFGLKPFDELIRMPKVDFDK